jgi:CubicO group peptidase (beta-lactamase class C family)
VTQETLFRIASTTKMLVGIALMRLVERGTLALDVPISTYLPWLRLSQPGLEQQITLRHLLSHTSGLCHFPADCTSRDPAGLESFVREYLPNYPIVVPLGQAWLYSNTGISLAAYIAQVMTSTPFWDLMQELVFDPLDMKRTTFDPLVAMTYPLALGHRRGNDGVWEVEHRFIQNTCWDPAGGAISTVHDLAHVALMFLAFGQYRHEQILSAESIRLMQTPQVKLWTLGEERYGLTLATERYKGLALVRHNGGGVSSYVSGFMLIPEKRAAIVLHGNGGPLAGLMRALLDDLFLLPETEPACATMPSNPSKWSDYVGTYLGIYTGLVVVEMVNQKLQLTRNGRTYLLEQHCQDHYIGNAEGYDAMISVGFPETKGGRTNVLVVDDSPCERLMVPYSMTPDPHRWASFVGTYMLPGESLTPSREITVALQDETLFLTRGTRTMQCLPIDTTMFACDEGVITFLETEDSMVLLFQRTMRAKRVKEKKRTVPGSQTTYENMQLDSDAPIWYPARGKRAV